MRYIKNSAASHRDFGYAIKVSANSYSMKLTQAKEKSLGLQQRIGLEMSLSMDSLFADRKNFTKNEE